MTLGFFDNFKELKGKWLAADQKNVLIENGIPFQITQVVFDPASQHGARYVATALIPDPENGAEEEMLVGFPISGVESRDRMLAAMMEYLDTPDSEPVMVKLEKVGRAILIRNATA